jgi:serine protease AprX
MRRRSGLLFAILACAAVPGPRPAPAEEPTPAPPFEAEGTRPPKGGAYYAVERDGPAGRKAFVGPDGARYASLGAVLAAEAALEDPAVAALSPDLRAAATDAARAAEPLFVNIRLRDRPTHAAAAALRTAFAPRFEAALAPARAALDRLSATLSYEERRGMDLRAQMEAEAALLEEAERAAFRRAVEDVAALREAFRREVRALAAAPGETLRRGVEEWVAAQPGARVVASNDTLGSVTAVLPAGLLTRLLAEVPTVGRVAPVGRYQGTMNSSPATIGAATWWTAGWNGSSLSEVGVLDTGVDSGHPALGGVTGEKTFLDASAYYYSYYFSSFDSTTDPDDFVGHGTHVAGTVVSSDATYGGVAPGTGVLNAKCGWYFGFLDPDIFAAGDWALDNGAVALNLSLGGGTPDGESDLTHFVDAAAFELLAVVAVAAGNAGPSSGSLGSPGDLYNGLSVASLDDKGTTTHTDNVLSSFSSRGPTYDGRRKPDITAPGSSITSCNSEWESQANFVTFDGTSMACPHVAGAASILFDYAATWSPEGMRALLLGTARNAAPYNTTPDSSWGHGGLDLAAAYAARASVAEGTIVATDAPYRLFRTGSLASGGRVTLAWNRHVISNGASAPLYARDLTDLDLYVYDEATGLPVVEASSSVNNTEQAKTGAALASPVVKVARWGSFPTGVGEEPFAIAAESASASVAVDPPELAPTFDALPFSVIAGDALTVTVHVANDGDVASRAGTVALTLPPGFLVQAGGPSTAALAAIPAGGSVSVSWTVVSPEEPSEGAFTALASSSCYGETYTGQGSSSTVRAIASPPPVPADFVATASSTSHVVLSWTDGGPEENSYEIERHDGDGAWTLVAAPAANAVSHADGGLAPGRRYTYRMRASNGFGSSDWSAEASARTYPSIVIEISKGLLVDSPKAGKDRFSARGRLTFNGSSPDGGFDPAQDELRILFGAADAEAEVAAAPGDAGWKERKGGKLRWKSPRGATPKVTLDLDRVGATFSLTVSGADLPQAPTGVIGVRILVGNDGASRQSTWLPKGAGKWKLP